MHKAKYHKYKFKYLALKNQHNQQKGGSLMYNPFVCQNKLIKHKIGDGGVLVFENELAPSNNFTHEQQNDINAFTNFILPFYKDGNQIFGIDAIKDITILRAGTFGITAYYKNILFKIFKIDFDNLETISGEIIISSYLFINNSGQPYAVPDQINKIYGYLTSNRLVNKAVTERYPVELNEHYTQMKLYTNLPNTLLDPLAIFNAVKDLEGYDQQKIRVMNGSIAILILEKADIALFEYFNIFFILELDKKLRIFSKFIRDMYAGLFYINITRSAVHNDIKAENIVAKYLENDILFQIIDFGLLQVLQDSNSMRRREGGTMMFLDVSTFKESTSILYDWHCIYIIVLQMLALIDVENGQFIYVDNRELVNSSTNYQRLSDYLLSKIGNTPDISDNNKLYVINILIYLAGAKFYHEHLIISKTTFNFAQVNSVITIESPRHFIEVLGQIIAS